jgi:hypothetical protein
VHNNDRPAKQYVQDGGGVLRPERPHYKQGAMSGIGEEDHISVYNEKIVDAFYGLKAALLITALYTEITMEILT